MKALLNAPFVRRVTKHLSQEDEEAIAAAVIPAPEPAEPELIAAFRGQQTAERTVMLQALPIAVVAMIPGFVMHSAEYCLAVGTSIVLLLIALFVVHKRCQIGEDAEKMILPVHHIEEGPGTGYAVCYLPDGKYHVRYSSKLLPPEKVCCIEFGAFTYWKNINTPHKIVEEPDRKDEES